MRAEGLLGEGESLYAAQNLNLLQHMHSALRALHLYHPDVDYIVAEGQVVMSTAHWPYHAGAPLVEGLHQAVEAKEALRFSVKAKRWRLLPSRTTSACMKSYRA